jgi:transcriptional regulator with XRE-family HTH domain
MQDIRVGAAFRAVRLRRGWSQADVAVRVGVSRSFVSLLERGHFGRVSLDTIRRVASALDIRIDLIARWRGGELDRLLNAGHSALNESVISDLLSLLGWTGLPEVSFAVYGERGVIDILAWHAPTRSLLVIELKTDVVDVNELIGTMDRKRRLADRVAREQGWDPSTVSCWVIVAHDKTNQRRIARHRMMLRAAFPADGRAMHRWLRRPEGSIRALSMWTIANPGDPSPTRRRRARPRAGAEG